MIAMAIMEQVQQLVAGFEDKYYAFLDALDAKGVPIYSIVDPIESTGIRSWIVFAAVPLLLIIALLAMSGGGGDFTVTVTDLDGPVQSASIFVSQSGETLYELETDATGKASFPRSGEVTIKVKSECGTPQRETIDTSTDSWWDVSFDCKPSAMAACLDLSQNRLLTSMYDDDYNSPSGCVIRVYEDDTGDTYIETGFKASDGYLDLAGDGTCPEETAWVHIDCDDHEYKAMLSDLLAEVETYGALIVGVKEIVNDYEEPPLASDGNPADGDVDRDDEYNAEELVAVPIKVEDTHGTGLEGVLLRAVRSNGEDLELYYSNTKDEATTDVSGYAIMKMPAGQKFYLAAKDSYGSHEPVLKGEYEAEPGMTNIKIEMEDGMKTTLYIKEKSTQKAIPYAEIVVRDKATGKVVFRGTADYRGRFVVNLVDGKEYTYETSSHEYDVYEGDVTGGEDTSTEMEQVDISKTGTVIVDVYSTHGTQEEFSGVYIYLVDENGKVLTKKKTSTSGHLTFTRIKEGKYTFEAAAPGSIDNQEVGEVEVVAGETTKHELLVQPTQARLKIKTLVNIRGDWLPKVDVDVALWDTEFQEVVEEAASGTTRSVEFAVDLYREYFFIASYVEDGVLYGPYKKSVKIKQLKEEEEALLEEVSESVDFVIDEEALEAGKTYNAELEIDLPYFEAYETYEDVFVEMFVGEVGDSADIERTPVLIEPIYLSDIAVTQDPVVTRVFKSDEYSGYESRPPADDYGTSKYLRVDMKYKEPATYAIPVQLYVRQRAEGNTKVSYKATWVSPRGDEIYSNDGLWEETELEIVAAGESGDHMLEAGQFQSYTASLEPNVITTNGYFYLKGTAKARNDINSWSIPVKILDGKAEAVSVEGVVAGKTPFSDDLSGSDFEVGGREAAFALDKDEVVEFTVTLRAVKRGVDIIAVLDDYENMLDFEVLKSNEETETQISGVEVAVSTRAEFDEEYKTYTVEEMMPANGKAFDIVLDFSAEQAAQAEIYLEASDNAIKFDESGGNDYHTPLSVSDGTKHAIKGYGSATGKGTITVYLWALGGDQPEYNGARSCELGLSEGYCDLEYGRLDYDLKVMFTEDGSTHDEATPQTDGAVVEVLKKGDETGAVGFGVVTDNKVVVGGEDCFISDDYNTYECAFDNKYSAGNKIMVSSSSSKFKTLKETFDVVGVKVIPASGRINFGTVCFEDACFEDGANAEESLREIVFENKYGEEKGIKTFRLPNRAGYEFSAEGTRYNSAGVEIDTVDEAEITQIMIPEGGSAKIFVTAEAKTVECRNSAVSTLEYKAGEMDETEELDVLISCDVEEEDVIAPEADEKEGFIVRESVPMGRIDRLSCSVDETEGSWAFVCDAQQMSLALLDAADDLYEDTGHYRAVYYYALGAEENFGPATVLESMNSFPNQVRFIEAVYNSEESAERSAVTDMVLEGLPECGVVKAELVKINDDEDVKVTVSNVLFGEGKDLIPNWCDPESRRYVVGLMNYDSWLRPDYGSYYAFDMSSGYNPIVFVEAVEALRVNNDIDLGQMFGYGIISGEDMVSERVGSNAHSFIKYKDCEIKSAGSCPTWAVTGFRSWQDEQLDEIEAGLLGDEECNEGYCLYTDGADEGRINPSKACFRDKCVSADAMANAKDYSVVAYYEIDEFNDIRLGLVYDNTYVVDTAEVLKGYRQLFAKRLFQYAVQGIEGDAWTGKRNTKMIYRPAADPDANDVVDLTGPEIVPGSFRVYEWVGEDPNFKVTGNTVVDLHVVLSGMEGVGDFTGYTCTMRNIGANGEARDERTEIVDTLDWCDDTSTPISAHLCSSTSQEQVVGLALPDWQLIPGSGSKTVEVYCTDPQGIPSGKMRANILLDASGMELVTQLQETFTTREEFVQIPKDPAVIKVRDRYSEIKYCELKPVGSVGNVEECDDNGDGVHDELDDTDNTLDSPRNYDDGCCTVGENTRDLYYYNAEVTCTSPKISKENDYTELELKCTDARGNPVVLGTTRVWQWADVVPDFELPGNFVFSTDIDDTTKTDVEDLQLWFDYSSGLGSARSNLFEFSQGGKEFRFSVKEASESSGAGRFELDFVASDSDGMTPKSCKYTVDTRDCGWENGDYWCGQSSSNSDWYTSTYTGQCSGIALSGTTDWKYTCPLQLAKNKENNVEVYCEDNSDSEDNSKTETVKITWDEEGPGVPSGGFREYTLDQYTFNSEVGAEVKNNAPTMEVQVRDNYISVEECVIEIDTSLEIGAPIRYTCVLDPRFTAYSGGAENPKDVMATCDLDATENVYTEIPVFFVNFDDNNMQMFCKDELGNWMLDDKDALSSLKGPEMDGKVVDEIVQACKWIREETDSATIMNAGWRDIGTSGSVEIKDDGLGSDDQLDTEGVAKVMWYEGGNSGSISKNDIIKKHNDEFQPGWNTVRHGVKRVSADCLSGGICTIGVTASLYAACTVAGAGVEVCKQSTSRVWSKSLSAAKGGVKTALKKGTSAFLRQAMFAGGRGWANGFMRLVITGSYTGLKTISAQHAEQSMKHSLENDYATFGDNDCTWSDSGYADREALYDLVLSTFIPGMQLLKIGMDDPLQALVCIPKGSLSGEGKYFFYVAGAKVDMEEAGGLGAVFSVCLDSCDDFACVVAVTKKDTPDSVVNVKGTNIG